MLGHFCQRLYGYKDFTSKGEKKGRRMGGTRTKWPIGEKALMCLPKTLNTAVYVNETTCFRTSKFVSLNLCLTTGEASKGGRALRELRGTQFSFFESCPWYSCPWFTMVQKYQKWWLTDYLFSYKLIKREFCTVPCNKHEKRR